MCPLEYDDEGFAPLSDIETIALRLQDEAPWESCANVLNHAGWRDVVETIKTTCPDAYHALLKEYVGKESDGPHG